MPTVTVTSNRLIRVSPEFGSTDEHMVSRIYFVIATGGRVWANVYADIKQTVGSRIETGLLEVSPPHGYAGPMNQAAFRAAAEQHFLSVIGSSGSGVSIPAGASGRMRDNVFTRSVTVSFEAEDHGSAW